MATTWGKMMSAPGDIVSGAGNMLISAGKLAIKAAVVVGFAITLGAVAHGVNWTDSNIAYDWLAKGANAVAPAVHGIIDGLGHLTGLLDASKSWFDVITPASGAATATTVASTGALSTFAKTVEGWATGLDKTVFDYASGAGLLSGVDARKVAVAATTLGAAGLATGAIVGDHTAKLAQQRAARAQAMAQLG